MNKKLFFTLSFAAIAAINVNAKTESFDEVSYINGKLSGNNYSTNKDGSLAGIGFSYKDGEKKDINLSLNTFRVQGAKDMEWINGVETYILENGTRGNTHSNVNQAFIDDTQANIILIAQTSIDDGGVGHAKSTLGKAEVRNSEFGFFLGANASGDKDVLSGTAILANNEANNKKDEDGTTLVNSYILLEDSKINSGFMGTSAMIDGGESATASSSSIFLRGLTAELKSFSYEEDKEPIGGGIFGSYAGGGDSNMPFNGTATATTNYIEISNGANITSEGSDRYGENAIFGSYAQGNKGATAKTGTFIIDTNGTKNIIKSNVTGAYASSYNGVATATTNSMYIMDNTSIKGDVYGAEANGGITNSSTAQAWMALIGSEANRTNNVIDGDIYVADAFGKDANASGNYLYVENFKVTGDIYGGYANTYNGTGNASNNSIFLANGTTVGGNVYGGYVSGNGNATNNTISLSGNVAFDKSSKIWGGYVSGNGDAFTGNTLNFFGAKPITVASVGNFQTYNFTLGTNSDITKKENALITTNEIIVPDGKTSTVNVAMTVNDFNKLNGKEVYLINNTSGEVAPNSAQMGEARVGMIYKTDASLKAENGVYSTTIGKNQNGQSDLTSNPNATMPTEESTLSGFENAGGSLTNPAKETPNLQVDNDSLANLKPLNQARLASLMLANQNADLVVNGVISKLNPMPLGDITPFALANGGHTKYKTNSSKNNIKSNDFNFVAGVGYNFDNTIAGWFFEYGKGKEKYKNKNEFSIKGDGTAKAYGIGLFSKSFIGDAYLDASLHLGRADVEFNTSSYTKNGYAYNPNYKHNTSYYGAHAGVGYVAGKGEANSFDTSMKFFYNHLNGKNQTIEDQKYKFKAVNSSRLQVGENYKFVANEYLALNAGAAYEYEFSAKAKAKTDGYNIKSANTKGSTYVGELGVSITPFEDKTNSSIDLNVKGYTGKKEGVSGGINFKYNF